MKIKRTKILAAATLSASIAACGSGGDDDPVLTQDPGGIWSGTDSVTGDFLYVYITEGGQLMALRGDGLVLSGQVAQAAAGGSVQGNVDGVAPFADGSSHGRGTFTGTLQPRSTLTLTVHFTTDKGTVVDDPVSLTYDTSYEKPVALATLAGTYTSSAYGSFYSTNSVSIDTSGNIFVQDPATGCTVNGRLSPPFPSFNLMTVTLQYQSCTGADTVLNGVTFNGLLAAGLDSAGQKSLYAFAAGGNKYGEEFYLTGN